MSMLFGLALVALAPIPNMEDGWFLDFEVAQEVAAKQGKAMLVNFTGSDWCGWCVHLDETVFSQLVYQEWARENVVQVKLDFPEGKKVPAWMEKQNEDLLEKYQVRGFPTILFLDAKGKVIGEHGVIDEEGPGPWVRQARRIIESGEYEYSSFAGAFGQSAYPPFVEKQLYADHDFRGKQGPKYEFGTVLKGGPVETKGKLVLVDYWATWCGPCRAVIPKLNEWAEKFKDDLIIVGLSDEPAETVKEFMGETAMNYVVAVDPEKKMSKQLGVKGIPHVTVQTPDGVVRWQGFPGSQEDPLTAEKLEQIIKAWKASQTMKS